MTVPSFRFRLERVHALRAAREDQAREAYAAGLTHRLKGEALLRAADEAIADAHRGQRGTLDREQSGDDLLAGAAWRERLARARVAAELDLRQREDELDLRRTELTSAARDREALDRLRDRQHAEHALAAERAEAARLDEIALNAHVRRSAAA